MSTAPSSPFRTAEGALYPLRLPHFQLRGEAIWCLDREVSASSSAAALLAKCDGVTPARSLRAGDRRLDHLYRRRMVLALPGPLGTRGGGRRAQSRPAIVFSPHPDDAALSLGGLLGSGRLGPVRIVTFFSRSAHSILEPGGDGADTAAVTCLREMEDRCAAEVLGGSVTFLDLPEALLRGKRNAFELIFWNDGEEEERLRATIAEEVDGLGLDLATADLFVPLGVGNHIDHVLVRDALLRLIPGRRRRRDGLFFYEELPYAAVFPGRTGLLDALARLGFELAPEVIDVTASIGLKTELLRIYLSQLTAEDIEGALAYAARLGGGGGDPAAPRVYGERFWTAAMGGPGARPYGGGR